MKKLLFILLGLPLQLLAQSETKNTLSIFEESNGASAGSGTPHITTIGAQYKRRFKKMTSWQATVGHIDYHLDPSGRYWGTKGDTTLLRSDKTSAYLVVAAVGIETSRQFYKRVHFFAGAEVRVGGGNGTMDTSITKMFMVGEPNPLTGSIQRIPHETRATIAGPDISMLYATLTPYIGARLVFKKFELGLTVLNSVVFTSQSVEGGATMGTLDIATNNFTKRLSVGYRF